MQDIEHHRDENACENELATISQQDGQLLVRYRANQAGPRPQPGQGANYGRLSMLRLRDPHGFGYHVRMFEDPRGLSLPPGSECLSKTRPGPQDPYQNCTDGSDYTDEGPGYKRQGSEYPLTSIILHRKRK